MSEYDVSGRVTKRPLRVGIVGIGGRSTSFAHYFSRHPGDGTIVALCDEIVEKCEVLTEHYKLEADVFSDVHEMLSRASLDALFVTTPDYAHCGPAVAGLEAGVHVFCEKPLATTLEDCDRIAAAGEKSSAVFYLGFNLRHGPVHETVHELVSEGKVGRVTTIEANEYYYGGKTYFRRWNRLRKYGGGLWITKACHDFDLLNWMAGSRATSVYAVSSLSHYKPRPEAGTQCRNCPLQLDCPDYYDARSFTDPEIRLIERLRLVAEEHGAEPSDLCLWNSDKDTFDNAIAVVTYENDVRATYTVNVLTARSTRQMRIIGTEAMLEADMTDGKILITERHTNKQWEYNMRALMASGHGGSDDREVKDFIRAVHTGTKPKTSWTEGRAAVELGLAARQSADSGEVITIPTS